MKNKLMLLILALSVISVVGCSRTTNTPKNIIEAEAVIEDGTESAQELTIAEDIAVTAEDLLSGKFNDVKEVTMYSTNEYEYGPENVYAAVSYNGTITVNEESTSLSGTYTSEIPTYSYLEECNENATIDYTSNTVTFNSEELDSKMLEVDSSNSLSSFGVDVSRFTVETFDSDEEYIYIFGSYKLTDKPNTVYDIYLSRLISMECPYAGDINNVTAFMTLRYDINTKNLVAVGIEPDVFDSGFSAYGYENEKEYIWLKMCSLSFKVK